jgi:hypothetical protein
MTISVQKRRLNKLETAIGPRGRVFATWTYEGESSEQTRERMRIDRGMQAEDLLVITGVPRCAAFSAGGYGQTSRHG